ncbi:cell envelope integrity EipB family protein [Nitratireductor sp. GISD-1A_MAKvit]|uniref:cell envelope integrity EipB family protein n=1 Tax=Nitratireductor sp. GISD-1A_MAKvit TaxID=3234198 RepID=UPI003466C5DE
MRSKRPVCLFLSFMLFGLGTAGAQAAPNLAAHRAVYDLTLGEASDRSGIDDIEGRMVYEFAGSACEGYTTTFRFVMRLETSETSRLSDQQTTTYEDGKGEVYQFVNKIYLDNVLDKEVKGIARLEDETTRVELSKPERRRETLEATRFPVKHLEELIEKAREGGGFYQTTLFDGSEDADRMMLTSVTIGKQQTAPAAGDGETKAAGALDKEPFWPVSIAYFDPATTTGETLPEYQISFLLYDSGITRSLDMDYGEFSIRGKLVDLTMFDEDQAKDDCSR